MKNLYLNLLQRKKFFFEQLIEDIDKHSNEELFILIFRQLTRLMNVIRPFESLFKASSDLYGDLYSQFYPLLVEFKTSIYQNPILFQRFYAYWLSTKDCIFDHNLKAFFNKYLPYAESLGAKLEDKSLRDSLKKLESVHQVKMGLFRRQADAASSKHLRFTSLELQGCTSDDLDRFKRADEKEADGTMYSVNFSSDASVILKFVDNDSVRQRYYERFIKVAEEENTPLIKEILSIRSEIAHILGKSNYAEVMLFNKSSSSTDEVLQLLEDVKREAFDISIKHKLSLESFVAEIECQADLELEPWQTSYYLRKYGEKVIKFEEKVFEEYFEVEHTFEEFFKMMESIYDIEFVKNDELSTENYRHYSVFRHKQIIAGLYVDPFQRPGSKSSGAWCDCVQYSIHDDNEELCPIVYFALNLTPTSPGGVTFFKHFDLRSIFHEMGHALHYFLTKLDGFIIGYDACAWDVIEVPSFFNEHILYSDNCVIKLSQHVNTREKLPVEIYQAFFKNSFLFEAISTLKTCNFSLIDYKLHLLTSLELNALDPHKLYFEHTKATVPFKVYPGNCFLCRFLHIFGVDQYIAGYYSYLWALIYALDLWQMVFDDTISLESRNEKKQKYIDNVLGFAGSLNWDDCFLSITNRKMKKDTFNKFYLA
eukprot:TRINITY_DN2215_c0_g1_i1.p1 TRINITY_DN2215_c0_g1~~TRINITY_DN2215_c0_g1_i1.p1  ORF type:complete len:651 (-),score=131.00 TRINITY_DN2215_c0_g1_i1:363-2315(-)